MVALGEVARRLALRVARPNAFALEALRRKAPHVARGVDAAEFQPDQRVQSPLIFGGKKSSATGSSLNMESARRLIYDPASAKSSARSSIPPGYRTLKFIFPSSVANSSNCLAVKCSVTS